MRCWVSFFSLSISFHSSLHLSFPIPSLLSLSSIGIPAFLSSLDSWDTCCIKAVWIPVSLFHRLSRLAFLPFSHSLLNTIAFTNFSLDCDEKDSRKKLIPPQQPKQSERKKKGNERRKGHTVFAWQKESKRPRSEPTRTFLLWQTQKNCVKGRKSLASTSHVYLSFFIERWFRGGRGGK